ncbi:twin-arginine translocation signal domain-containing protein [Natronomonas gomsonensis]|uniref:twin-arginine translocation signal domain-containing protein n=1 Tax=Natronomonas gomsonensis TaxID=1046043 RepID=UPI0020CA36BA|nr:twin-arginine translocation signal domain-containing protein [Natronomonas gomsonensis]MCY4732477.1 twin-arginine translocation signal domain-containing protein [Natronomonas gomsonensis]
MSEIDRRTFIKGAGVATGVAATGAGASTLDLEPVGRSKAVAPIFVAAGGAAVGWALYSAYDAMTADSVPEGMTADAALQSIYETLHTRQSTNASTFVDNRNMLDGISNNAYTDGKVAAIEGLNAEKSQSAVQDQMVAAVDAYQATVTKNLVKSWNESVRELENVVSTVESHSDLSQNDIFDDGSDTVSFPSSETVDLVDGTTIDVEQVELNEQRSAGDGTQSWDCFGITNSDPDSYPDPELVMNINGNQFTYMRAKGASESDWKTLTDEIATTFDDARNGLITWLDGVYGSVQAGDIQVSDLITPRERAEMMTEDGDYPQAVADLVALNVPVDFERKATVKLHDHDVVLEGTLGVTDDSTTIETGTQYSPSADGLGSVYLTYDVGSGEGTWTAYDDASGVDGGTVTFTKEPLTEVTYQINTNYDETAEVKAGDFSEGTDGSGNTIWTVDVSGQLENAIAEIESVNYVTKTDETRYETIRIRGPFTVQKFVNEETGEEANSAEFTSAQPQNDSNYVTQEEWNQLEQQNQELIEEYEDSKSGSGGGGLLPNAPDIPGWGIVVAVGGIALVLLGQTDDNGY